VKARTSVTVTKSTGLHERRGASTTNYQGGGKSPGKDRVGGGRISIRSTTGIVQSIRGRSFKKEAFYHKNREQRANTSHIPLYAEHPSDKKDLIVRESAHALQEKLLEGGL